MTSYLDDNEIPEWAREAAEKAEAMGFGTPSSNGTLFLPRGVLTRAEFVTALDKFGLLADVPVDPEDPEDPVDPVDPEPPTGGNIDEWLPEDFTAKVALPQGHIGAFPDAETVNGPLKGDHSNKIVRVTAGTHFVLRDGTFTNITVINPDGHPVNSYAKNCSLYNCALLDVSGDAFKASTGETVAAVDTVVTMSRTATGGPTDKHYDGLQAFRSGHARLVRVLFDWVDIGLRANTTAAVFTHDEASLYLRDVTILNPAGTYQIVRLQASGVHDVDRIHVSGSQGLTPHNKLAPTALVLFSNGAKDQFTLHNDVPGAADWLIG